ncbi:hypothetical protein HDU76_013519 [Blyttiomyces sp. JEL0837]|nr:hypothetical protein HDU76_013519 [Blyttiomyces sp. JEL0837]
MPISRIAFKVESTSGGGTTTGSMDQASHEATARSDSLNAETDARSGLLASGSIGQEQQASMTLRSRTIRARNGNASNNDIALVNVQQNGSGTGAPTAGMVHSRNRGYGTK